MSGRIRVGAMLVAGLMTVPLAGATADVLTNNLVLSSNPAFNPTPGNDNGVIYEILEVPVNGTATVNVTLVADAVCDASVGTPLVLDVVTATAPGPAFIGDLSTILGRTITGSATTATVAPDPITFTGCGAPQTLTVSAGATANRAMIVNFDNVAPPPGTCQTGSTCVLTGRFVVVTRDPDQSLPGVVSGSINWALGTSLATMQPDVTFTLGVRPLVPVMGDWNGDGTETPGYFKTGTFFLSNSVNGSTTDQTFTFGNPGGFPVAGDFNGDGTDDLAVVRAGVWEVRFSTGAILPPFPFGPALNWPTVVPVAGDWNGDGTDGIGVYNLQGGGPIGEWNLRQTASPGGPELTFIFGGASLYPVVGDWDGDGTDGVGTKAQAGTAWSLRNTPSAGPADRTIQFGTGGSFPVVWKKA